MSLPTQTPGNCLKPQYHVNAIGVRVLSEERIRIHHGWISNNFRVGWAGFKEISICLYLSMMICEQYNHFARKGWVASNVGLIRIVVRNNQFVLLTDLGLHL